jgi:hypothetical protein
MPHPSNALRQWNDENVCAELRDKRMEPAPVVLFGLIAAKKDVE